MEEFAGMDPDGVRPALWGSHLHFFEAQRVPGLFRKRTHKMVMHSGSLYLHMLLLTQRPSNKSPEVGLYGDKGQAFCLFVLGPDLHSWAGHFPDWFKAMHVTHLSYILGPPPHISDEKTQLKINLFSGRAASRSKIQLGLEARSLDPRTKLWWSMQGEGRRNNGIHAKYSVTESQSF